MIGRILLVLAAVAGAVTVLALFDGQCSECCAEPHEHDHRCTATTSSGGRCSRTSEPGSDLCWQHGG